MDPRLIKLSLGAIFLISLASLGAIVVFINPYRTSPLNLMLFSVVLLMLFFGLFSWLGFWLRQKFVTERNLNRILKIVFREGILLAVLGLAYLWLSHARLFRIWIAMPLLILFLAAEYFFLLGNNRR